MKYWGVEVVGWAEESRCAVCGAPGRTCRPREDYSGWPGLRAVFEFDDRGPCLRVKHYLCTTHYEMYDTWVRLWEKERKDADAGC